MRRGWAWVAVAVALSVGGCDKVKELTKGKKGETTSATGKKPSKADRAKALAGAVIDAPDAELSRKLNQYIVCINGVSASAHRSRLRYLGWVDAGAGPTGKERHIYGLYPLTQVDNCRKALERADHLSAPTPVLDAAAVAYRASLDKLVPQVEAANDYYQGEKHKADAMKQGQAMHAPLLAAFDAFLSADAALRDAVSGKSDEFAERDLLRLERAGGKRLQWYTQAMMLRAKVVIRTGDVPDLSELDAAVFQTRLNNFEQSVRALDRYAKANPAEAKKVMMFSMVVTDAKKLGKAGRALLRRAEEKRAYTDAELSQIDRNSGWMVDGHPAQLQREYNGLVDRTNRLRWR